MATYIYSLSLDFPSGLDISQLNTEIINNISITTLLISIDIDTINPDNVIITFISALSPAELIALNNTITSYVPIFPQDEEPIIKIQDDESILPAISPINISFFDLAAGILFGAPISNPTQLILPLPAIIVANITNASINYAFDFSVINQDIVNDYVVNAGIQTVIGNPTVIALSSGNFRIKLSNVTPGLESYILYRIS